MFHSVNCVYVRVHVQRRTLSKDQVTVLASCACSTLLSVKQHHALLSRLLPDVVTGLL